MSSAPPELRSRSLHLLGATRLERDGLESTLSARQPRLLLGYLALHRDRATPREVLASLLWPGGTTKHWEGALRGIVTTVRSFLANLGVDDAGRALASIESSPEGYHLWIDDGVNLDIRDLESERNPVSAAPEIFKAPFLVGLDADWVDAARAHFHRAVQRWLRVAVETELAQGRHGPAVAFATQALDGDAYDERNLRILMAAHLAAGNRAAALQTYSQGRRAIADAMGLPPEAATEALYLEALEIEAGSSTPSGKGISEAATPWWRGSSGRAFVGRDAELAALQRVWDDVRNARRRGVIVRGAPGVGKTRLVLEAVTRTGAAQVLLGRCAEGLMPFGPLGEALGGFLTELPEHERSQVVGPWWAELALVVPELVPDLASGARSGRRLDRPTVLDALEATLRRVAVRPTVLLLDDAQWADHSTVLFLRQLMTASDDCALLVVATVSDGPGTDDELNTLWREVGPSGGALTVELGGLETVDTIELLARAGRADADVLGPVLQDRTGGNAYYLTQILSDDDGSTTLDPFALPDSTTELVRHHLAMLTPGARDLVTIAATIGPSVPIDLLEGAAHDGSDADELRSRVGELIAHQLVHHVSPSELVFSNGVVRDAVYDQLSRARRRRLHTHVAEAIQSRSERGPQLQRALAEHYLAADDPALLPLTVDATIGAAERDLEALGFEDAMDVLGRALDHVQRWSPTEPRRAELQLGLGRARRRVGDAEGATVVLLEAVEVSRANDLAVAFAESVLELVARGWRGAASNMADHDRVLLLQEAADRLGREHPALRVAVLVELALALVLPEHQDRQREISEEAVAAARSWGGSDVLARAVEAHRLFRTRPTDARARLAFTDGLIAPHRLPASRLVRVHMWRLHDQLELGDRAGLERELFAVEDLANRLGQPHWVWVAATWRALLLHLDGERDAADHLATTALEDAAGVDQEARMLAYGIQLLGFQLIRGRGSEVITPLRLGIAATPQFVAIRCALALALAQSGTPEGREESGRLVSEILADDIAALPDDLGRPLGLACLALASCELGDADAAAQVIPALEPYRNHFVAISAAGPAGACWGPYAMLLGSLRACGGDRSAAQRDFDHALVLLRSFPAPLLTERVTLAREHWLGAR